MKNIKWIAVVIVMVGMFMIGNEAQGKQLKQYYNDIPLIASKSQGFNDMAMIKEFNEASDISYMVVVKAVKYNKGNRVMFADNEGELLSVPNDKSIVDGETYVLHVSRSNFKVLSIMTTTQVMDLDSGKEVMEDNLRIIKKNDNKTKGLTM